MKNKTPALTACICASQQAWAFSKAKRKWPKIKLGLIGVDAQGAYHFQEFANNTPFIMDKFGK